MKLMHTFIIVNKKPYFICEQKLHVDLIKNNKQTNQVHENDI